MTIPAEDRTLPREDKSAQQTHYTTCYMCACRCGIQVTTQNGKVRFIQGNRNHPVNQGVLCAKGSAGIMKQNSPAKLRKPLLRKPGSARGSGELVEIEWDQALDMLTARLAKIRSTNPTQLAFFTGRDQMQALSGLWAQQFGTPNWAAHGGFCSVNMAVAGLYTIGYSFWEFGTPDFDLAKYFVLWGVAEDHSSNPIKIGLEKLKRHGAKFVSINPVRTGYSAIADEWIPVRPGTDGLLALAIVHVLLTDGTIDFAFLSRHTNAPWLVVQAPGTSQDGLFARNDAGTPLVFDEATQTFVDASGADIRPALFGAWTLPDGRQAATVLSLAASRYLDTRYAPATVAAECGVPAETIVKLAREMAHVAFKESIELPIRWTDMWGRTHDSVVGRPVAMYAMRGISAHSNGFHTCRALHLIQMLLGALDGPGNFRARAPYPRRIPLRSLPENDPAVIFAPDTPLKRMPNGNPTKPEELVIDANGAPLRIDGAYSWASPLAAHGLMHMVIANAANHDPYPIDTLLLFMANMAWNSSMNTAGTREMLSRKDANGDYAIPFIVVVDAFHSETVGFADLVLPDTTYLERYDAISLLDRPISEPDAAADAIRHPVVELDRDVRPWQDVLVELASRLKLPAFTQPDGARKFADYKDFIVNYEKFPGIGFLAGWRGENGESHLRGKPNPRQWEKYIENQSFFTFHWPESMRYYKYANKDYLEFAEKHALFGTPPTAVTMQIYSEPLQKFRLAGQGHYDGPQPTIASDRERIATYFDPLPIWYPPLEAQRIAADDYPLHAITQRPMTMYHSWDSQNAWLRQILSANHLYMNRGTASQLGLADEDWVWVESHHGRVRCRLRTMEGVEASTVWTWNAVGKQAGAWGLASDAPEATTGFLLNHLISELLPKAGDDPRRLPNADPVTGQAAWFDLRVRVRKAAPGETGAWPVFDPLPPLPGDARSPATSALERTMKLGLVIDLDTCVGCHACATACKEWNGASAISGPLTDDDPYGADPTGVWFNRVRHYEVGAYPASKTINFPMSCMHCEDADCVTVCPTGASYKRKDGIVLVDQDKCMGCNLCAWACPYGARELDPSSGTMKKCTLCVDRIHDLSLPEPERQPACVLACPAHARFFGDFDDPASEVSQITAARGGFGLMPELGYKPVNRYLPPREPPQVPADATVAQTHNGSAANALARLIDAARRAVGG